MRVADCHPDQKYYGKGLCRTCYNREHNRKRPKRADYFTQYRETHADKFDGYAEARASNPEKRARDLECKRWNSIEAKYGLSKAQVEARLESQNRSCALCEQPFEDTPERVGYCIDHCHQTGRVRGLLCTGCNTGLGLLGDNVTGLNRALEYLQRK